MTKLEMMHIFKGVTPPFCTLVYTRIENAHKIRKKTFVFHHVAVICITTGETERDTGATIGQETVKELRSMTVTKNKKIVIYCMFIYFHQQCRPQK